MTRIFPQTPRPRRAGFVLITALAMTAAGAILLGGVLAYIAHATRRTAIHLGETECILAAQSVVENIKSEIHNRFYDHSGRDDKISLIKGKSFEWFNTLSGPKSRTIGIAPNKVELPALVQVGECSVAPYIHEASQISTTGAVVTIRAQATRTNPDGSHSTATVEESVAFSIAVSQVFNYAYFVNNYGWFKGSGVTANGDVRANGDLYLDSRCYINGHAYASVNAELGVLGEIENEGRMYTRSEYWNANSGASRARPTAQAGTSATSTAPGGYDAPETIKPGATAARLHPHQRELYMPYISELDGYIEYAREVGGTLSGGYTYTYVNDDGEMKLDSDDTPTIHAHYSGAGPSGDMSLADRGALVIEGTRSNPIRINGPVVIDSDVIIKGYVSGQGTIYSGRNIHIVGNIQYIDPPTWTHPNNNPEAQRQANRSKDMLGLAAKGNIILGNYTANSWLGSGSDGLAYYMRNTPYVQRYKCDPSDADIGYPAIFGGDYTAADGGSKVITQTTGGWLGSPRVSVQKNSPTRKYYESVVNPILVNYIAGGSRTATTISHIDAILYNNHGVIGRLNSCTINGSLVCRNEATIYNGSLKINWDHRLFSGVSEDASTAAGLPKDAAHPPVTTRWRRIAEDEF